MCAASCKIEVPVAVMPVMRTKPCHLKDIMSKAAKDRSSGNIADSFPVFGSIVYLKFYMVFNIIKSLLPEAFKDCRAGHGFQSLPILPELFVNMSGCNSRYTYGKSAFATNISAEIPSLLFNIIFSAIFPCIQIFVTGLL